MAATYNMSLFDRSFSRRTGGRARGDMWSGLEPPPISVGMILGDLRWHAALYREDDLPFPTRLGFLGLRVLQRLSYNAGWFWGGRS
jgi:hypothetical protein